MVKMFTSVFQYSWYFFEALVKSMAQYLMESGKVKVNTIICLNKLSFTKNVPLLYYKKITMVTVVFSQNILIKTVKTL